MSDDLSAKYGADAFEAGIKIQGKAFENRLAQRAINHQSLLRQCIWHKQPVLRHRAAGSGNWSIC